MYIQKPQIPTVPTKELVIILPFLGKMFHIIKTRITKFMNKHIKFGNLRVIFHTNNRLRNYLHFKYFVPETLWSSLIYKFSYRICTTSYTGKTYQHFKVRVSENQCVSPRTCKPVKGTLSTMLGITCLFVTIQQYMKILGSLVMSLTDIYWNLKKIYSLKEINHHLMRTYILGSYYCFEYSIWDNFFLFNFATDIISDMWNNYFISSIYFIYSNNFYIICFFLIFFLFGLLLVFYTILKYFHSP